LQASLSDGVLDKRFQRDMVRSLKTGLRLRKGMDEGKDAADGLGHAASGPSHQHPIHIYGSP